MAPKTWHNPIGADDYGESMPVLTKQNWWEAVRLPASDSHFNPNWAITSFSVQALAGGSPSRKRWMTASLKDEVKIADWIATWEKEFPDLGLIEEAISPPGTKDDESIWYYGTGNLFVRLEFDGDRKMELGVYGTNLERVNAVLEYFKANTTKTIPSGRVHVLVTTQDGPAFSSMGIGGEELIRDNYSDEVLRGYDRIVQDLTADLPAGRVAILNGKPGTGKTFLVRGLLSEVKDCIMVLVPASLIAQLAQPGMIPALVELHKENDGKAMIFIIEDADEVLAPRMGDNMSAVSAVLNLGDGILGKLLDIRIVATTNAHRADMDDAIMRPGRLSASVLVGPLPYEKALSVFLRLAPGESLEPGSYTLAEIYSKARDNGWVPPPTKKAVGFESNHNQLKKVY